MRALTGIAISTLLLLSACGGSDGSTADSSSVSSSTPSQSVSTTVAVAPRTGGTCPSVADETIGLLRSMIEILDGMPPAELATLDFANSDTMPAELWEAVLDGYDVQSWSELLRCDDAEMIELLRARVDRLDTGSQLAEAIMTSILVGENPFFG